MKQCKRLFGDRHSAASWYVGIKKWWRASIATFLQTAANPTLRIEAFFPLAEGIAYAWSSIVDAPKRRKKVAEREGFEPPIGVNLYSLSRGALSTTQPSLRAGPAAWPSTRPGSRYHWPAKRSNCGAGSIRRSFSRSTLCRETWRASPSGESSVSSRLRRMALARSITGFGTPARRATWMP